MNVKRILSLFAVSGTIALLPIGFTACTASQTQAGGNGSSPAPQLAQSPMSGMDHGDMKEGMDHSSMSMDLGPQDENFDLRFVDGMIPHHEGGVIMAQDALRNSKRAEIRQLAQAIIDAQDQEIAQMKQWRQAWYPNAGDTPMMYDASMGHMMPMTEEMRASMMMEIDLGTADDQFDLRFLNAMIPHHEGALDMAQQALEKSDRAELKELAQSILTSQQKEIDQMKQWRQQWYGQ